MWLVLFLLQQVLMVCAFVFRSLRGVRKKQIIREKEKPISRREESEQEKSQNKRRDMFCKLWINFLFRNSIISYWNKVNYYNTA